MIDVKGLTYTYPGAAAATVKGHEFRVAQGEVFGFLGPSGAGKSTTQNILIGLLEGYEGQVDVLGQSLASWGPDYYRRIGVSFELPNHYLKLTAQENLRYFCDLYGAPATVVEEVLSLVDLTSHADKPVGAFSKGMKNRLNFARSLLHGPELWFLDEPTSGLDPVNAVRIRELILSRKKQGVTTMLTTHDMHTAEAVCDRVAFIVDGQIQLIDTPDELRRRYGKRELRLTFQAGDDLTFPLDGLVQNEPFQQAIQRPELLTMHSQETTLEDVFVQVTGKRLS